MKTSQTKITTSPTKSLCTKSRTNYSLAKLAKFDIWQYAWCIFVGRVIVAGFACPDNPGAAPDKDAIKYKSNKDIMQQLAIHDGDEYEVVYHHHEFIV